MTAPEDDTDRTDAGGEGVDQLALRLARLQRPLFAYVLALVCDVHQAEDILQNTNIKLLASRGRQDIQNFDGWAREIARFEYLAYRKRHRRRVLDLLSDEMLADLANQSFQRAIDNDDRLQALQVCRRKLTTEDRSLIDLRYAHGQSIGDIASKTGRTVGAVRQVLYRIRVALMRCIEARVGRMEWQRGT